MTCHRKFSLVIKIFKYEIKKVLIINLKNVANINLHFRKI